MKNSRGYGSTGVPVGTVTTRTRHKRGGETRAWVKVAQPNVWKLRAQVVWETTHGPMPRGSVVHHKDENTLNDTIDNLELLTKAQHLAEHVDDYRERSIASWIKKRRALRWSTRSKTGKRVGRHPRLCACPIHGGTQ